MKYKVILHPKVYKGLTKKFDPYQARLISNWLNNNIDGSTNPYVHGKPLQANLRGLWRYRIGNYRAISLIIDNIALVLVLKIAHRREIYHGIDLQQIHLRANKFIRTHPKLFR